MATRSSQTRYSRIAPRQNSGAVFAVDAPLSLQSGRVMARAWSESLDSRRRQAAAWSFMAESVQGYVEATGDGLGWPVQVPALALALSFQLDSSALELARTLGRVAATLPIEEACYELSACYTAMLPQSRRSELGAYYTPPALTSRLLDMATEAGTDWSTASVLDPACGGGAFLLPVALRMRTELGATSPVALIEHFQSHLQGFEIDPFAAWLTQAWLEIAFAKELRSVGCRFPAVVRVCDSLEQTPSQEKFDLVVGNPPYGRIQLSASLRETYRRSLFGHANLYGIFTDLAIRWTKSGGVIAYVTPTSFLGGEYYKALRNLLADEAPPTAVDFVSARKGVFEDALQETMLATYRRGRRAAMAAVHHLIVDSSDQARITHAGRFKLPARRSDPWPAPRHPEQQVLSDRLLAMKTRLSDWGYKVSTGPLVWNRFKDQLRSRPGKDTYPLIWAESVTASGEFIFRADKRNHQPFFRTLPIDEWLKVTTPCVLLQRTTSKEQARRLIAAELPSAFIEKHGSVVVENHLNMVKPIGPITRVSPGAVAAILNSPIVDQAFRCISGSVAVSAFELEALPLPSVDEMQEIEALVKKRASSKVIQDRIFSFYMGEARQ